MTFVCLVCEKPFSVRPYRAKTVKYCSIACHGLALRRRPTFTCTECGEAKSPEDFYRDSSKPRGYVARCKVCYRRRQEIDGDRPPRRYAMAKENAKRRGLEWALTKEEFQTFWQKPCHYCGVPIATVGLDRVDNARGYILENIVSCCAICNAMKAALTLDVFLEHVCHIAERFTPFKVTR